MEKIVKLFLVIIVLGLCTISQFSLAKDAQVNETGLTVGMVQKSVCVGMNQSDLASVLGSPNIVTKDASDKEVWIYDKIGSIVSSSSSGFNIGAGGLGGGIGGDGLGGGLGFMGFKKNKSVCMATQKTLTVIIKFNCKQQIETISYHSSTF